MQNNFDNQDGMVVQPIAQPNKLFMTEAEHINIFEFYLMGEIVEPDSYTELCHALRVAEPTDLFIIRINSNGGQNRSGDMIINAIRDSQAHVVGHIEHHCMSMATFIFLACDSWDFSRYAEFMAHTCSSGSFGKEPDTFEAAQFLRKQTHKRLREEYKDFLTEEEIERVVAGNDVYLDADDIAVRLETFAEAREKAREESKETPEPTIVDLIKDAVREVLDERERMDLESLDEIADEMEAEVDLDSFETIYGQLKE